MYTQIHCQSVKVVLGRPFLRNIITAIAATLALCLILAQTAAADNLITNPGFETGDTTGWSSTGCPITVSSSVKHGGSYSGKAYDRIQTWKGFLQPLLGKMEAGKTYTISGWMMLENASGNGDTIQATIRKIDDSGTSYTTMCMSTGFNGEWTVLSGLYTLTVSGTLTSLDLYFEGPQAYVNYYLDDVNVVLYEPPTPQPNATGEVDFGTVYQQLDGFGGSAVYDVPALVGRGYKEEIYDLLFRDLGLDILRIRNCCGYDDASVTATGQIIAEANERAEMNVRPHLKLKLVPWSPPGYLKSLGTHNGGTLAKSGDNYVYDAYADWWADSLDIWASNDVHPDYISIQNEPDYDNTSYDSCRFLPTETSSYAGYDQAFEAVYNELYSRMGSDMPKMLAPETMGFGGSKAYINALVNRGQIDHVYGFSHHLYGDGSYDTPDGMIPGMQGYAANYGYKPLFMTEYCRLDTIPNFDIALKMAHHIYNCLVYEGVTSYYHWSLFRDGTYNTGGAINLGASDYTIRDIYWFLKHYSYFTDSGWYRIGASTDSNGLRMTAFKNPDSNQLTVVIVNISSSVDVNLTLTLNDFSPTSSEVYRSSQTEHWLYLGTFNQSQPLLLPRQSITTISMGNSGWGWKPLSSGMNDDVYASTVYNGELIVGGNFTTAGGVEANCIARWNGSNWQPLGSGMNDWVYALTVYNGELIAGGRFVFADGDPANRKIARWNGSSWQPLGSGIFGGVACSVTTLTVYNGELIAGGSFTTAGGVAANCIARWNGTNWQPLGNGMNNGLVYALTVYNGELIAGGSFTTAGGSAANRIARWNGSNWQPLGSGVNVVVLALTVYNGELISGGNFTTAGGVDVNGIARWNGTNWQPLGNGMNNGLVRALTVYNGELITGGSFTTAGDVDANYIARWDGDNWRSLGSGMGRDYPLVYALTVYEGELIAGGHFSTAGGIPADSIARWGLPVNYKGDLNHDSVVDMLDMDWLTGHWLDSDCFASGWCYEADLNYDFVVDFKDYALLAEQWINGP